MKAFVETLKDIRDGELLAELPSKVAALVEAVRGTGKKGKLTITLSLAQAKGGMLVLEDDVKLVLPEPEKDTTTVFFATDDNSLTRRDPRQPNLPGVRGVVTAMPPAADRTADSNG